ncbi:MAG: hypothetical protein ACYDCQ_20215 [Dehalococcoidia bacterium]
MSAEPRSLDEIRHIGLAALQQALGPVGMVRFLQHSETGAGDYTADREQWLGRLSLTELIDELEDQRHKD